MYWNVHVKNGGVRLVYCLYLTVELLVEKTPVPPEDIFYISRLTREHPRLDENLQNIFLPNILSPAPHAPEYQNPT
ncbi:hypothetical protein OUZ56_016372 [Daphnia magna]|uniref:Uncharacterized protein n=1 Tax=Daphnia magna TaxID=35525 RepID=A0ABR0AQG5_9CRUS|nr:hypothetical protein OUZ56_016372 [Daphnia magna]